MFVAGYLVYFTVFLAADIVDNPYNKRIENQQNKVVRGDILSADGQVLATTVTDENGNEMREYPYGSLFSHVVGLDSAKTGIEGSANFSLLSTSGDFIEEISNGLSGDKNKGNNVITTLDTRIQKAAETAMEDCKGAVIVMEPDTGKIIAMVSKPDYNPNDALTDYAEWLTYESKDSVLLNRATLGLYSPGSTFKMLTALEYIREHADYAAYTYNCMGSTTVNEGTTVPCYNGTAHGRQTLKKGFANSCNCMFSNIIFELNIDEFAKTCESFLFNKSLNADFETGISSFSLKKSDSVSLKQETGFGQGKTMISPIHNLMIVSAFANGGKMMKPYLIDEVVSYNGNVLEKTKAEKLADVCTKSEADAMTELLRAVITEGTAQDISYVTYDIAGKTGLAQYDDNNTQLSHSWFTGFAPASNPEIAICVILEGETRGNNIARIVAREILDVYFK